MKLYAIVKSERATEGQGGNKDLLTIFTAEIAGERQEIMSVSIINTDKGFYSVDVIMPDKQLIHQKVSKGDVLLKANKQKTA